jgi:hypothetical protein
MITKKKFEICCYCNEDNTDSDHLVVEGRKLVELSLTHFNNHTMKSCLFTRFESALQYVGLMEFNSVQQHSVAKQEERALSESKTCHVLICVYEEER